MHEANERLVRSYVEFFNQAQFERIAHFCAHDVKIYGVLGHGGLGVATPISRDLHHAFGTTLVIEDIAANGDQIAVRY